MMLPLRSITTMQFSHRKSTPALPASESSPTLPLTSSAPGGLACVAFRRSPITGNDEVWRDLRKRRALDPGQNRQLAPLHDVHTVGALGEDSLTCPPGPFLVSGKRAEVLGPVGHDVIGPGHVQGADGGFDTAANPPRGPD